MAKKRVLCDRKSEENRKRSRASGWTISVSNEKQEKNVLNDGLLSLYKKELGTNGEKSSTIQNQCFADNKQKEIEVSVLKTPSKTGKRSKNAAYIPKESKVTFRDVGGADDLLEDVLDMFLHYRIPAFYQKLGFLRARGILLHGPPGCGKTHIAHAIAGQLKIPILKVASTELVRGVSGESESKIRDAFDTAVTTGRCLLFFDEIEAMCPKRETTDNPMMIRMVDQMIQSLDDLYERDPDANVMVVAATNIPDAIDPALRRGMRFDREFAVGIPNEDARLKILQVLCKDMKLSPDFDLCWLVHNTPGYVGADLRSLKIRASDIGFKRIKRQLVELTTAKSIGSNMVSRADNSNLKSKLEKAIDFYETVDISDEEADKYYFIEEDFRVALTQCVPYSKREGFASIPHTSWDDIGALEHVKEDLRDEILWPVKERKFHEINDIPCNSGILLHGPKGCGKTLLAKAIANESGINFISVKGSEFSNKYFGESEKAVIKCFERARNTAPCVIFFDEFDALCPRRSNSSDHSPTEKVVNMLLTETSGVEGRRNQVFLIAATNRLDKIDSAMLRPERFENIIYVGLPTPEERLDILKSVTKKKTFEKGFDLEKVAFDPRCDNFSGADLVYLVTKAARKAMKEMRKTFGILEDQVFVICWKHFDEVLNTLKASNSEQDRKYYEKSSSHHSCT